MPTFGSLFSGIGGLDLGLERAGWECKWQVELDEWCRAVLARHWPGVPRWDDAKTFPPTDAESNGRGTRWAERELGVDLICGGFPCQPVSNAGRRLAQDDARWLWPEFARIVRVLRPRLVLVENVTGLLARGMGDVLGELAACGYDAEWDCIPAAAVGAPHLRYRVFVVAHANGDALREQPEPVAGSSGAALASDDGEAGDVAHANGLGQGRPATVGSPSLAGVRAGQAGAEPDGPGARGAHPNPDGAGWTDPEGSTGPQTGWGSVFGSGGPRQRSDQWVVEPDVGRVAHGVPARVDRLRALGNAVVPQVAEWIGRRLLDA